MNRLLRWENNCLELLSYNILLVKFVLLHEKNIFQLAIGYFDDFYSKCLIFFVVFHYSHKPFDIKASGPRMSIQFVR